MSRVRRIHFLVRSLEVGGAERQLVGLARGLHERGLPVVVVTFYAGGALAAELRAAGVRIVSLDKRGRWDLLRFFVRLVGHLRRERPDLLYAFMPSANLAALIARVFVPGLKIAWGVRASSVDMRNYDWLARLEVSAAARAARWADFIICNSNAGFAHHERLGYPSQRLSVVPNGIDTVRFRYDARARESLRRQWRVSDREILVGNVGRLDPIKGQRTFIEAAARLAPRVPEAWFACIGGGDSAYLAELRQLTRDLGLADKWIWVGHRDDMAGVFSALDIVVSASYGEGFPNTIAEAMACGRVCVASDTGDTRRILADTGKVVPPRDAAALAEALAESIIMPASERQAMGDAARGRVEESFSLDAMLEQTCRVLDLACGDEGGRA